MARKTQKKNMYRSLIVTTLLFLVVIATFALIENPLVQREKITISTVAQEIKDEQIEKITIRGEQLLIQVKEGNEQEAEKEIETSLAEQLTALGVSGEQISGVEIEVQNNSGMTFFLTTILPFVIPFLLIAGFIWFMLRSVQGGNKRALSFGQTNARETKPEEQKRRIKFKDVAGMEVPKEELLEVVDFLREPAKFLALGARIPSGVLLVGPPGTGKTLLARAVAGEAKVPFYHLSGSEFVEMFVGVGASRVRDLFKKAKKSAPSLIFIDEIDAVGRQRGAGLGGSHDEREQTLNQILVEMDGFDTDNNVIVIAATNRPDVLDPALLRPGRFDRRVVIERPDVKERDAILKIHARGKQLGAGVDLAEVAQRTVGFTGADLENLLNEAAIFAARRNRKKITQDMILNAIEKVMLGPERRSHILSEKEKKITAYHEAGHALVSTMLPNTDPVRKVSLVSRGMAGGYTLKAPSEDRHMHTKSEFLEELSVMLAGHITEKEIFGEVTTGASNDLRQATELARKLVIDFGMSDVLGPISYGDKDEMIFLGREIGEQRNYSESTAAKIDTEIRVFIDQQYEVARGLILKHRAKLDEISAKLLEVEILERAEFMEFFKDVPETPEKSLPEEVADEPAKLQPKPGEATDTA